MTTPAPSANAPKKIAVITGSAGMVGSALVPALERAGYVCRRLVRRPSRGEKEYEWHPDRGSLDPAAIDGAHVVINLAGEKIDQRWTRSTKKEIMESRVRGTSLLVDTIGRVQSRPEVMISMSAVGVYGNHG